MRSQVNLPLFDRNLILANLTLAMDPSASRICSAFGSRSIDTVTRSLLRTRRDNGQRALDHDAFSDAEKNAIKALAGCFERLVGIVYVKQGSEAALEWVSDTLSGLTPSGRCVLHAVNIAHAQAEVCTDIGILYKLLINIFV